MEWQEVRSAAVRLQLQISEKYPDITWVSVRTGRNQTAPYSQRRDIYTDCRRERDKYCL